MKIALVIYLVALLLSSSYARKQLFVLNSGDITAFHMMCGNNSLIGYKDIK